MAVTPTPNLTDFLARFFTRDEPVDDAAHAMLEKMNEAERRIAEVQANVRRGIRKREGRFRL